MSVTITAPPAGNVTEPFTVTIDYDLPSGTYLLDCSVGTLSDSKGNVSGTGSWTTVSFTPGAGPQEIIASVMGLPDTDTRFVTVEGPGMPPDGSAESGPAAERV